MIIIVINNYNYYYSFIIMNIVISERSLPVQYERNASSFPVGDLNDNRVKERLSNTIHSVYSKVCIKHKNN